MLKASLQRCSSAPPTRHAGALSTVVFAAVRSSCQQRFISPEHTCCVRSVWIARHRCRSAAGAPSSIDLGWSARSARLLQSPHTHRLYTVMHTPTDLQVLRPRWNSAKSSRAWRSSGGGWRSAGSQTSGLFRGTAWTAAVTPDAAGRPQAPSECRCCGSGASCPPHAGSLCILGEAAARS